jgi:hypothetical protein
MFFECLFLLGVLFLGKARASLKVLQFCRLQTLSQIVYHPYKACSEVCSSLFTGNVGNQKKVYNITLSTCFNIMKLFSLSLKFVANKLEICSCREY